MNYFDADLPALASPPFGQCEETVCEFDRWRPTIDPTRSQSPRMDYCHSEKLLRCNRTRSCSPSTSIRSSQRGQTKGNLSADTVNTGARSIGGHRDVKHSLRGFGIRGNGLETPASRDLLSGKPSQTCEDASNRPRTRTDDQNRTGFGRWRRTDRGRRNRFPHDRQQ